MICVTMRLIQAPGFVVRAALDVMMEDRVANALSSMVQANRNDELVRTQVNIDKVVEELVRRTEILGAAIHQITETAKHSHIQM